MNLYRQTLDYFLIFMTWVNATTFSASSVPAKKGFDLVSPANDGLLPENYCNGDRSKITPDGRFVVYRSAETKNVFLYDANVVPHIRRVSSEKGLLPEKLRKTDWVLSAKSLEPVLV